jgi:uncharacterized protein
MCRTTVHPVKKSGQEKSPVLVRASCRELDRIVVYFDSVNHHYGCTRKGNAMISDAIRQFVEKADYAFVASVDEKGSPHLATGTGPNCPDSGHLAFEAWFCQKTLRNAALNPRLAVAIIDRSGNGYQFTGTVEKLADTAFLDGIVPGKEASGMPQVRSRLAFRVDEVMELTADGHSDLPL